MLTPGLQLGKYLLGRKLGQGGFGVVFLAQDSSLDREVALKFLNPEHTASPQILQRFLQEARSAAKIAHPGIVTVYECGQIAGTNSAADGTAFIAMELLVGESLTDRLARSGRLGPTEAMEIARQVASALEAAHRAGIVHRDLKPDNIFLVQDPAVVNGERIKVLDFGIAKLGRTATSSIQTQSMMVFGTPRYMSPEQCKSAAHVDFRSDIYTLGCILYELVAGKPPFAGAPGELIACHVLVEAPAVTSIVPDVPPALAELIATMLAKEPDHRPPTMAAVQRALESGGALAPGAAPTLAPNQIAALPRITAGAFGVPPSTAPSGSRVEPMRAANPTTLGAAASSSVVRRAQQSGRKRTLVLGAGALVVVAGAVTWFAVRGGEGTKPQTVAQTTPPPPDSSPVVPKPDPVKPDVKPDPTPDPKPASKPDPKVDPRRADRSRPTATVTHKPSQVVKPPKAVEDPIDAPGSLTVRTKPSCEISIDGGGSFHTPIRGFKLTTGKHRVTLVNGELGVNESFTVDIKSGATESIDRDYSSRTRPKGKDKTINPFAQGSATP
jgi:serine/threonine-protein kinase